MRLLQKNESALEPVRVSVEAVRVSVEAVRVSIEAVRVSIEALRCLRGRERLEEVPENVN
jgi:hypothetical protein